MSHEGHNVIGRSWTLPNTGVVVAGLCSLFSCIISLHLVYKHVRNYTQPAVQRCIVRILLMVPIYSLESLLALIFADQGLYFELIRDMYEAYAIYQFFKLLVAYMESEEQLISVLEAKPRMRHPIPFCCLPTFKPGAFFLRYTKIMILQFVIIKPTVGVIAIACELGSVYHDGSFSPRYAALYLTIADNISVTLSMYYLVLFYLAAREELKPFKPELKFICIKAVIFFSFWQGVVISALVFFNVIHDFPQLGYTADDISNNLQDFLICFEMLCYAVLHTFAFSYRDFRNMEKTPFLRDIKHNVVPLIRNFTDVVNQKDVLADTYNTFEPSSLFEEARKHRLKKRLSELTQSSTDSTTGEELQFGADIFDLDDDVREASQRFLDLQTADQPSGWRATFSRLSSRLSGALHRNSGNGETLALIDAEIQRQSAVEDRR